MSKAGTNEELERRANRILGKQEQGTVIHSSTEKKVAITAPVVAYGLLLLHYLKVI